jgi:hypothetical protein
MDVWMTIATQIQGSRPLEGIGRAADVDGSEPPMMPGVDRVGKSTSFWATNFSFDVVVRSVPENYFEQVIDGDFAEMRAPNASQGFSTLCKAHASIRGVSDAAVSRCHLG